MTDPSPSGKQKGGERAAEDAPAASAPRSKSLADLRDIYADQAHLLDLLAPCNRLFTGGFRRRLFGRAEGRVLDVACGTGLNARYLPAAVDYVGVDASPAMLAKAADRDEVCVRNGDCLEMDAQALAVADDSVDTVISSLSTCTFPDPVAALDEMARVVRSDGEVLLLEHGRSSVGPIARFQDLRAEPFYEKHGCQWTQEPLDNLAASALTVEESTSDPLGVLTAIEAVPA